MSAIESTPRLSGLRLATVVDVASHHLGAPLLDIELLVDVAGDRLVLRGRAGATTVIVKGFADAPALRSASTVAWLDHALASAAHVVVARPLAVDHEHQVIVAPDLGPSSLDLLPGGPGADLLRLAGSAIAEIHSIVPKTSSGLVPVTAADHLAQLIDPGPARLAEHVPHRARVIAAAVEQVEGCDQRWRRVGRPSVIHRDLHLRQLVPSGDRMGIVDWDLAAVGDPVFDIAYLLTYLETHDADPDGSRAAAFVAGYGAVEHGAAVLAEPDLAQRLRGYRLFNLVRRASRRQRLGDAGWVDERDRLLDLVADALDHDGNRP